MKMIKVFKIQKKKIISNSSNLNSSSSVPVFLKSTIPDADIKMNDLFEFSESSEADQSKFKNKIIKKNMSKNTKLTNWFVKK